MLECQRDGRKTWKLYQGDRFCAMSDQLWTFLHPLSFMYFIWLLLMCCEDEMKHREHAHSGFQGFSRASQLLPAGSNVYGAASDGSVRSFVSSCTPQGLSLKHISLLSLRRSPGPSAARCQPSAAGCWQEEEPPKGKRKPWVLLWELSGQVAVFPARVPKHLSDDTSLAWLCMGSVSAPTLEQCRSSMEFHSYFCCPMVTSGWSYWAAWQVWNELHGLSKSPFADREKQRGAVPSGQDVSTECPVTVRNQLNKLWAPEWYPGVISCLPRQWASCLVCSWLSLLLLLSSKASLSWNLLFLRCCPQPRDVPS